MEQFRGELITVDVGAEDFSIGSAKVMARPIPHSGITLGFRIEAEGRAVAYMSDHQAPLDRRAIPEAVLELCAGVDLLIHDAQYTDDEFSDKADWGHSTAAYAVHVAAESGARRLLLSHHDPSHTDRELDRMLNQARRLPEAKRRRGRVLRREESQSIDLGKAIGHGRVSGLDQARFREVLGHFATGVTIVTALEDGVPVGFTCQSFAALSLDPPMVLLAPARSSTSWPRIAKAGAFCVNILDEHQEALCRAFAVSGGDKFDGVGWRPGSRGAGDRRLAGRGRVPAR